MGSKYRQSLTTAVLAFAAIVGILYVGFHWLTTGVATVSGETDNIASAALTNGEVRQPMRQLPNGTLFAVANLEGTIEIVCRNGERRHMGYVTPHMSTTVVARKRGQCVDLTEES